MALEAKRPDNIYRSFALMEPLSKNTEVHVASCRTDSKYLDLLSHVHSGALKHFNVPTLRNHLGLYGHPLPKMRKE